MEQTLEEFKRQHKRSRKDIQNIIRNCFGTYDLYKMIRRNHWYNIGKPVSQGDFYRIIRGINKLLAEELLKGNEVKFPAKMGKLELRKIEVGAFFQNGKLTVTYPIDWQATWQLWQKDAEAFQQKTLKRHENQWVYKVYYNKLNATYPNKTFYQFKLNQDLRKALSKNIKQGITDTLYGTRNQIYKHS